MGGSGRADLLVVGGGPVGVVTALLAAHEGLRAVVVERSTGVFDLPRAIVMDDEVQRVFQRVGLFDELRGLLTPIRGGEFLGPDGVRVVGVEFPEDDPDGLAQDWPLGHWPVAAYYQPELETFLRRAAGLAGVELRLGLEVVAIGQDLDGAWAEVRPAGRPDDPTERLAADWLVAADGASSAVRKQLGIAFEDQGFDQEWLVVDARVRHAGVDLPRLAQQVCDPARPTTFIPGHGPYRRWEFQLQPGEDRSTFEDLDAVWALVGQFAGPEDVELLRTAVYRFHALVASTLRSGRVFLAGDAAHQMPPFLGQGLCAGVRDAANLTWKVAAVQHGRAGAALLDTYDRERRPHAAGVVEHAVDAGRLIDQIAGRVEAGVGTDAGYGGGRPFPHLEEGLLDPGHALVGRQLVQPRYGNGLLDDLLPAGWAVLVPSDRGAAAPDGTALAEWESFGAEVVEVDDAGAAFPVLGEVGALVVRPDRYVAAVATADHRLVGPAALDPSLGAPVDDGAPALTVTLTGTGTPHPSPGRAGAGVLVRYGDVSLLFDAGRATVLRLAEAGCGPEHLHAVFVTHVHSDHLVGLADVVLTRWVLSNMVPRPPLVVVAPDGASARFVDRMLVPFDEDVALRVAHTGAAPLEVDRRTFAPSGVPQVVWVDDERGVVVEAVAVHHEPVLGAVAYRVSTPAGVVVISGDTRVCDEVGALSEGADLLVHEACRTRALAPVASGTVLEAITSYHADTVALGEMARAADVRHLVLTHLIPAPASPLEELGFVSDVREGGFTGRLTVGQDLQTFTLDRNVRAGR